MGRLWEGQTKLDEDATIHIRISPHIAFSVTRSVAQMAADSPYGCTQRARPSGQICAQVNDLDTVLAAVPPGAGFGLSACIEAGGGLAAGLAVLLLLLLVLALASNQPLGWFLWLALLGPLLAMDVWTPVGMYVAVPAPAPLLVVPVCSRSHQGLSMQSLRQQHEAAMLCHSVSFRIRRATAALTGGRADYRGSGAVQFT
eukprot:scaffold7328_cov314-Pinguiococcus_pyrenoidosus.AAC.26